ncbi:MULTISPECIES: hypothetical protein [Leptolyngbya]|jgi:hypothetical protein|uniref:hypothetical protein n=1 Tax=Leptolyngbya TaxID=47251 RepID=UPI001683210D|nr:hypothetical protein [Leptolyngbya sp. FACHB-1624]MBD1856467.1 hypothetical protein [Leptolyngbya sp. FACHB-1624]
MSQSTPENSKTELNDLRMRCHQLIDAIAKRPGAIKLLKLAEKALVLYSEYKSNRKYGNR